MINENKFDEIFKPIDHERKQEKKRALEHYQNELDKVHLEILILEYKTTGQHPCSVNTKILISDLEEESGVKITQTAINGFQEYLTDEILRVGDYDL